MVVAFYQGSSNKKQEVGDKEEDAEAEASFEQSFVNELVKYGGIKRAVAIKTLEKATIEDKTLHLTNILQKIKDGTMEVDDQDGEDDTDNAASNTNCRTEETALMQNFLKRAYMESMAKEHAETDDSRPPAAAANEKKLELASEYEKVMMRLNNMYCRQIFWNMIKKDNMEELFKALFNRESDIKAFATFLKVIGNESYITKNTRQIKSFGKFIEDVIMTCKRNKQFMPLLEIMVYDGIITAYSTHMMDLRLENDLRPKYYISEYFKTESSAL